MISTHLGRELIILGLCCFIFLFLQADCATATTSAARPPSSCSMSLRASPTSPCPTGTRVHAHNNTHRCARVDVDSADGAEPIVKSHRRPALLSPSLLLQISCACARTSPSCCAETRLTARTARFVEGRRTGSPACLCARWLVRSRHAHSFFPPLRLFLPCF